MTDEKPKLSISLTRFAYTPDGTFGEFNLNGSTYYTVERPWLDNKPNVSCIPEQDYICRPSRFYRGGYDTWEVTGVPGRSRILIHIANTMRDVKGCIGLGNDLGYVNGLWAVTRSKNTFEEFMKELKEVNEFKLRIRQINGAKQQIVTYRPA